MVITAQSQNILHTVLYCSIAEYGVVGWGGGAVIHLHGCRVDSLFMELLKRRKTRETIRKGVGGWTH
jgi:hypothetical protein